MRVPRALASGRVPWRSAGYGDILIDVDLRPAGESERQFQAVLGPGDQMTFPEKATMGAALIHPTLGRVITTAGHVFVKGGYANLDFSAQPRRVSMANVVAGHAAPGFEGHAIKAVLSADTDYSIVVPTTEAQNLFEDESVFQLSGVHVADDKDVGTPLMVLTCRGVMNTVLLGVGGAVDVGKLFAQGLLLTTEVTIPGDSGSCLVDQNFTLWGFLIGTARIGGVRHSVFISPEWVLSLESSTLA